MLKKAVWGLCGLLAATVMQPNILLAETNKNETSSIVSKISFAKEAYAQEPIAVAPPAMMPNPTVIQIEDNLCFRDYLHKLPSLRYANEEPTREELESVEVYRIYYYAEDKKEFIEEKIMEGANKSEWKDNWGIEKVSTKLKENNVKIQLILKDSRSKSVKRDITIKKDFDSSNIEIRYNIRF
ncbi:MAG: hypothetical protein V1886_01065 [archaeon]